MKLGKKTLTINSLSAFLLVATLITVGFLSFSGMLLLSPYLSVGILSAAFAVLVEGEVYWQNIKKSIRKIFTTNFLQKKIIENELATLILNKKLMNQSKFLQEYQAQLDYLAKLKKEHATKAQIKKAKKRIKAMQQFFSQAVFNEKFSQKDALGLEQVVTAKYRAELQAKLIRQKKLNRIMMVLHALAGAACALTSIFSIHSGLLLLLGGTVLAPTLMWGGIVPLGILAGIGYSMLMYHSVSDMIANETIQKLWSKFREFISNKNGENKLKFVAKVSVVGLVAAVAIGLAIFATIATAGTWWIAAKKGASLLPYVAKAASWMRDVVVSGMFIPTLLFNLKNSFQTLNEIKQFSLTMNLNKSIKKIKATKKKETWIEFLNPFRIIIKAIELPFKFIAFIGHLMSIAVMSNGIKYVPAPVSTALNCTNETLIDAHYFMEKGHHHKNEHDHHHGIIIKKLLKFVLSPLYICSALWIYAFSIEKSNSSFSSEFKKFLHQLKKSFGDKEENEVNPDSKPSVSNEWKYQELMLKVNKKLASFEKKKRSEEIKIVAKLKKELEKIKPLENTEASDHANGKSSNINTVLRSNSFFTEEKTSPEVKNFLDKLITGNEYAIPFCQRT